MKTKSFSANKLFTTHKSETERDFTKCVVIYISQFFNSQNIQISVYNTNFKLNMFRTRYLIRTNSVTSLLTDAFQTKPDTLKSINYLPN